MTGQKGEDQTAARLLETLRRAGPGGLSPAALKLEPAARAAKPRREALAGLLADQRALSLGAGRAQRFLLAEFAPTAESTAERLLTAFPQTSPPALHGKADFSKKLPVFERPLLDAALDLLQARREILPFRQGRSLLYAFAAPVKDWLSAASHPAPTAADSEARLFAAYHRLVRESGGFPDVKISQLRGIPGIPAALSERLVALWREGRATLSLGDWSLASEEMRAAAVELDGERYLLVRLEDANDLPG